MHRVLGALCYVIGHDVAEWVPFLRQTRREELGVCVRCDRVTARGHR